MPRRTLKDVVGDDGSQAENRRRQVIESALAEKLGELLKKSGKRIEKKDSKRTKYVKRPRVFNQTQNSFKTKNPSLTNDLNRNRKDDTTRHILPVNRRQSGLRR